MLQDGIKWEMLFLNRIRTALNVVLVQILKRKKNQSVVVSVNVSVSSNIKIGILIMIPNFQLILKKVV